MDLQKRLLQQVLRLRAIAASAVEVGEERRRERRVEAFERVHRSRLIGRHELPQLVLIHTITLLGLPTGSSNVSG